jgi:geranylgeranyl pyrophosphate synthase
VLGLEQAKACARDLVECALAELGIFAKKGEALAALARYIVERKR